jgi:hypothetical protein
VKNEKMGDSKLVEKNRKREGSLVFVALFIVS